MLDEDRERFSGTRREAVAANRGFEIELRLRRSLDGADRWHLIRFAPIQDRSGEPGWLGTAMDIEDLKQAEMAVQKKQKWESIGLLAGGIAHDFNNLLVGILGGASLLEDTLPAEDENRSTLKTIIQSSERAAHLTRQLLAYSGQGQFYIERVDLSDLARETCDLIQSSIPSGVQLSVQSTGPIAIEADAGQMQQVITSLVMNGVEAIPEQGTVSVRTFVADGSTNIPQVHVGPDALAPGCHAVLEVQDTGAGMDAATKAKIFDPFFTTKFLGRGLGLAAVQGILRSAKGQIDVDSALGKGSTFRVFLPVPRVTAGPELTSAPVMVAPKDNSAGTILLIDDEPAVRQMMSAALGRAGYKVLAAGDGPTGLRILGEQQDSISLVFLDMGMPQMGGEKILRGVRASGCQVPVVICSGYSEPEVLTHFAGCEFSAFIQKPFKMNELLRRVNDLLKAIPAQR
jgi:signal transduction histidine kinase/CheY-like chemotaxis protein